MNKTNLAFKCNFCNGGSDIDCIHYGYNGVCSEAVIKYNITKAKYDWCSQPTCACNQFYKNKISYDELRNIYKNEGSICYESAMINKWEALAGFNNNGEKAGTTRRIVNSEVGSLAVLTLTTPNTNEYERRIFAIFLIDEYDEGDNEYEGYVACDSKYKLHFTKAETNGLRFWDYYNNENSYECRWGSGLFRYITDEQAAQILKRATQVKKGTKDEVLSKEFLDHYCKIKNITKIDEPSGAKTKMWGAK